MCRGKKIVLIRYDSLDNSNFASSKISKPLIGIQLTVILISDHEIDECSRLWGKNRSIKKGLLNKFEMFWLSKTEKGCIPVWVNHPSWNFVQSSFGRIFLVKESQRSMKPKNRAQSSGLRKNSLEESFWWCKYSK